MSLISNLAVFFHNIVNFTFLYPLCLLYLSIHFVIASLPPALSQLALSLFHQIHLGFLHDRLYLKAPCQA